MEPVKAGEMAVLMETCCEPTSKHRGWIGVVMAIESPGPVPCSSCDHVTTGVAAKIRICRVGYVPLSWLKPIRGLPEKIERDEEVTA